MNTLPLGTELSDGKYRIERVLGKGGFGITYQALDVKLKQPIAIKEYCPAENVERSKTGKLTLPNRYIDEFQQGKNKFCDEAQTLSKFRDLNIGHTNNYFEENDTAYMVMEFIKGQSLSQELKVAPTGKLNIARVTEIMNVLVKVLTTVHAKGVYHLDIKPENVISTSDRGIVLVDFGSCRQVQFGTKSLRTFDPNYAPPELIGANVAVGAYSDVFELGMLVHTLLVGKPPASSFERFFHPTKDPVDSSLSPEWASLIRSAIALQPFDRHQSVEEWWEKSTGKNGERVKESEKAKEGDEKREKKGKKGKLTFSFQTAQVKLHNNKYVITKIPGEATFFVEDLGNGVELEMVYVPGGQFYMGSLEKDNERPQHKVKVPAFYLSKFPITQAQYLESIGINNSHFSGNLQRPIESVSWSEAKAFCDKLAERTNKAYSLPSEAQWEYACRASTETPFYFGQKNSSDLANYDASNPNSQTYGTYGKNRKTTTKVGTLPPNSFGLYDLYGNVWEWCLDTWHENYDNAPEDGSPWLDKSNNNYRVVRGGSWQDYAASCRSAHRGKYAPNTKKNNIGFRIALSI